MKSLLLLFTFIPAIPIAHRLDNIAAIEEVTREVTIATGHFDGVYKKLRREEGNYVWDSHDFGSETYGGITRRYNPKWEGWKYVDITKAQCGGRLQRNQRIDKAEPHVWNYYHTLWKQWGMDVITDSLAATCTFDFAICSTSSIKVIQKTLQGMGHKVKADGTMSMDEAKAINSVDPSAYVKTLCVARKDFYMTISSKLHRVKGPSGKYLTDTVGHKAYLRAFAPVVIKEGYVYGRTQKRFLAGWLARANRTLSKLKRPKKP